MLHPSTTLVICYLACLTLRQPVTSLDLTRWALQGHLPYLDMPNRYSDLPCDKRSIIVKDEFIPASDILPWRFVALNAAL